LLDRPKEDVHASHQQTAGQPDIVLSLDLLGQPP
jgi:hypothetical protein